MSSEEKGRDIERITFERLNALIRKHESPAFIGLGLLGISLDVLSGLFEDIEAAASLEELKAAAKARRSPLRAVLDGRKALLQELRDFKAINNLEEDV
jgi:hypothetical protein